MVGKTHPLWRAGRFLWDIEEGGLVMGIINTTPDSFSDGGAYADPEEAIDRALEMEAEGAAIIDVGGESTRPGADPVDAEDELARVRPVIEGVRRRSGIGISVDTSKASVARAAIGAGADIVNDITGLRGDPGMFDVLAESGAGVVVMHMQGEPRTMQRDPHYGDVVAEVIEFYLERMEKMEAAGITRDRIILDPGIGFGKTLEHNLALLRAIPEQVEATGRPLLVGVSRKSMFAGLLGANEISDRHWPTVALTSYCREHGAGILRVHEVADNVQALRMTEALR